MVSTRSMDDTEAWKQSIHRAKQNLPDKAAQLDAMLEGSSGCHQWTQTNHPRPTFCNYCREKLSGVPWHGYTCDICKVKAHRKCMEKIVDKCKWTIEANIPQHLQYISPDNSIVPHQWVEGNLPMPAKCLTCDKPCGSVRRLQDWRCLWCACTVHSGCLSQIGRGCSLGTTSLSIIPPLAIREVSPDGKVVLREDAYGTTTTSTSTSAGQASSSCKRFGAGGDCGGGSPLIVLVNSKSGDNQGQRIVKKFRRLLNPIQVFDIIATGPEFALTFFSNLFAFRVLVCGGDGTVGWVLSTFDKLNLHSKCQLAILPLGTGNDLARVLGWGHAFYDDSQLPNLVRTAERAHTQMLDRWSVLSIEGPEADKVRQYEEVIIEKVRAVLEAEKPRDVIIAVSGLCTKIRELIGGVGATFKRVEEWELEEGTETLDPMSEHCTVLLEKLDRLMISLQDDVTEIEEEGNEPDDELEDGSAVALDELKRRGSLVNRANSLKKTLLDMIAMAERGLEQHYSSNNKSELEEMMKNRRKFLRVTRESSSASAKRERFRKKRSKTSPGGVKTSNSNLSSSSNNSAPDSPSGRNVSRSPLVSLPVPSEGGDESRGLLNTATATSAFELSQSQSLSSSTNDQLTITSATTVTVADSQSMSSKVEGVDGEERVNPSIGQVQPPTPSGTREPSTAFDEEDDVVQAAESISSRDVEIEVEAEELVTAVTMKMQKTQTPSKDMATDRPRIYSDSRLLEGSPSKTGSAQSNKKECKAGKFRLHPSSNEKIKMSYSDSSLYETNEFSTHGPKTASGTGGSSSQTTSRGATASIGDGSWGRIVKERKRQSKEGAGGDVFGSTSSSHLRSCRNILSGFAGGSLIAEVLLLNAKVLGSGTNPMAIDCHGPLDQYKETCVMNNYFGIGLDAKIALDFHEKRELSEKTRSRSKLFFWYGMLGGRELMHRSYKNLDQRIRLECDGVPIELPTLQGIVILNIPSYSGGANFWGRNKGDSFTAQSFDDRVLEVVALYGVIHVATSRVPNVARLQNHRIAQCRHVRIVILGNEPIPVQVDGEPRLQPPGIMQIVHKNRAQMLVRNPVFDATLKKWEEQQEKSGTTAPSTPTALTSTVNVSDDGPFAQRAGEFVQLVYSEIAQLMVSNVLLEALEVAATAVKSGGAVDVETIGDMSEREEALAAVERVVELLEDHFGWPERSRAPLGQRQPRLGPAPHFNFEIHGGDEPENWRYAINSIRQEMDREEAALRDLRNQKMREILGVRPKRSRLAAWLSKRLGRGGGRYNDDVMTWSADEVTIWLQSIGLPQYCAQFKSNDVQGSELIHLERADIHELGVMKLGQVKRLQSAIAELREKETERRRAIVRREESSSRRAQSSRATVDLTTQPSTSSVSMSSTTPRGLGSSRVAKTASLSADGAAKRTSLSVATEDRPSALSL